MCSWEKERWTEKRLIMDAKSGASVTELMKALSGSNAVMYGR
jgi:hypothetical protein